MPSEDLNIVDAAVFWPESSDPLFNLVGTFDPSLPGGFPSSDHRLVSVDVQVSGVSVPEPTSTIGLFSLGILGIIRHHCNSDRRRKSNEK